jgi:hypothetical protein
LQLSPPEPATLLDVNSFVWTLTAFFVRDSTWFLKSKSKALHRCNPSKPF